MKHKIQDSDPSEVMWKLQIKKDGEICLSANNKEMFKCYTDGSWWVNRSGLDMLGFSDED